MAASCLHYLSAYFGNAKPAEHVLDCALNTSTDCRIMKPEDKLHVVWVATEGGDFDDAALQSYRDAMQAAKVRTCSANAFCAANSGNAVQSTQPQGHC